MYLKNHLHGGHLKSGKVYYGNATRDAVTLGDMKGPIYDVKAMEIRWIFMYMWMLLLWQFFYSSLGSLIKRETPPQYFHVSACLSSTWAHKAIFRIFYSLGLYNEQIRHRTNVKARTKRAVQSSLLLRFLQEYKDLQGYSIANDLTEIFYNELS